MRAGACCLWNSPSTRVRGCADRYFNARASPTGLLRAVLTGGAGQLAPGAPLLYVPRAALRTAYCISTVRTAYISGVRGMKPRQYDGSPACCLTYRILPGLSSAYRGTTGARCSEPSSATRVQPAPSEAQRVICALALGTVEPAPRPGKRPLAPPSYWIGV